jgi:hypothetical protein
MSVLQKLTEGIVNRDLSKEGAALLDKWEATGLLEGLEDQGRQGMAVLLENQAKELLREASSMGGGDVEGFAAVAFPIVRRVFGGLVANNLVSVQPMSLPSGLIFFLDFTYTNGVNGIDSGDSLYGGGRVGKGILSGATDLTEAGGGFYNLQSGYSSPSASLSISTYAGTLTATAVSSLTEAQKKIIRHDPDLLSETAEQVIELFINLTGTLKDQLNRENLQAISGAVEGNDRLVRRLTHLSSSTENTPYSKSPATADRLVLIVRSDDGAVATAAGALKIHFPIKDTFSTTAVGAVVGGDPFDLEGAGSTPDGTYDSVTRNTIAEIDIKVDSVAVTAMTKKLKAKWSPELAQDLNAYHNLDAEVELTSILSEQIALELDQEILNDLVQGSTAGRFYWSRRPGRFVDRDTGSDISTYSNESLLGADFTGTVSEWYETLVETINDVSAQIHRKTLRGGANFIVCGPETANILEFTAGFRATVTADDNTGQIGAVKVGALSKKWDVYVDPYFLRNVVLVGRKGNSFLESGYVYAPYVPLQVTPTIFGVEDFTPRKGVMTRYAKQMVRPDMYGLVIVRDFTG